MASVPIFSTKKKKTLPYFSSSDVKTPLAFLTNNHRHSSSSVFFLSGGLLLAVASRIGSCLVTDLLSICEKKTFVFDVGKTDMQDFGWTEAIQGNITQNFIYFIIIDCRR